MNGDSDPDVKPLAAPDGQVAPVPALPSPGDVAAAASLYDQTDAFKALGESRISGLHPDVHLMGREKYDAAPDSDFVAALRESPGLLEYASRSNAHAAVVAPDAGKFQQAEHALSGKIERMPLVAGMYGGGVPSEVAEAGFNLALNVGSSLKIGAARTWLGLQAFAGMIYSDAAESLSALATVPLVPPISGDAGPGGAVKVALDSVLAGPREALDESMRRTWEQATQEPEGVTGPVSAGVSKVVQAVPMVGGLMVASAVGGPEVAFTGMLASSVGNLKLAGVDEDTALMFGTISASLGTWLGSTLAGGILPKAAADGAVGASRAALEEAASSPLVTDALTKFGRHAVYSWLLNTSMGISDAVALQVQSGSLDLPELVNNSRSAAADSLALLPFAAVGPAVEYHRERGQFLEAHADALQVALGLHPLGETELAKSPGELADLVKSIVGDDRPAWLHPDQADALAKLHGLDPAVLGDALVGRQGAYAESRETGGKLRVPLSKLAQFAADVGQFSSGVSLHADGATVDELSGGDYTSPLAPGEMPAKPPPGTGPESKAYSSFYAGKAQAKPGEAPTLPMAGVVKAYAEDRVSRMTVGELEAAGGRGGYQDQALKAQRRMETFQAIEAKKAAEALGLGQTAAEHGVEAAESGQASSVGAGDRSISDALLRESVREQNAAEKHYLKSVGKEIEAGDAALEAARYERQRDLNAALEKVRARTISGVEKMRSYLESSATDETRRDVHAGGEHYRVLLDTITEGLGAREKSRYPYAMPFDAALTKFVQLHGQPQWDAGHIAGLLDGAKPGPREFTDLHPWEAQNVKNALTDIRTRSADATKIGAEGRSYTFNEFIAKADAEASRFTGVWPKAASGGVYGSKGGAAPKFRFGDKPPVLSPAGLAAAHSTLATLLHPFGPAAENLAHQLFYANDLNAELLGKLLPEYVVPPELRGSALDDVPAPPADRSKRFRAFLPETVKRQDVWRMATMAASEDGTRKLAAGFGVSEAEIHAYLQEHIRTKPEIDFIERRLRVGDEKIFPVATAVEAHRSGIPPEPIKPLDLLFNQENVGEAGTTPRFVKGGHDPFKWLAYDQNGRALPVDKAAVMQSMLEQAGHDTPHGYLKERIEYYAAVPDISYSAYQSHISAVAYDISHANLAAKLNDLVNHSAFQEMVLAHKGKPWLDAIEQQAKIATLGHTVHAANGAAATERMLGFAKGAATTAMFASNVRVSAQMLTHVPFEAFAAPESGGLIGMAKGMLHVVTDGGWSEAEEHTAVWNRITNYQRDMPKVFQDSLGFGPSKLNAAMGWLGFHIAHAVDQVLTKTTYISFKYAAMERGVPEAEAMQLAGDAVHKYLPPLHVTEQSNAARHSLYGFLVATRLFPDVVLNAQMVLHADTDKAINAGVSPAMARAAEIGRNLGIAGALALGGYVAGHGKREDESYSQYAARSMLSEATYGHPFAYAAMRSVLPFVPGLAGKRGLKEDFFQSPAGGWASREFEDLGKVFARKQPIDARFWGTVDAVSRATGLVPTALLPSVKGAVELAGGKFNQARLSPLDVLDILAYGPDHRDSDFFRDVQKPFRKPYQPKRGRR